MVDEVREYVFGSDPSTEAVARWRQGLTFANVPHNNARGEGCHSTTDASTSTADDSVVAVLTQISGGPCALLAPLQAHVFKVLLFNQLVGIDTHTHTHNKQPHTHTQPQPHTHTQPQPHTHTQPQPHTHTQPQTTGETHPHTTDHDEQIRKSITSAEEQMTSTDTQQHTPVATDDHSHAQAHTHPHTPTHTPSTVTPTPTTSTETEQPPHTPARERQQSQPIATDRAQYPPWLLMTQHTATDVLVKAICNVIHQARPDPISINGVPRESAYVVCLVEGNFPSADFGDLHSRLVAMRVHSADELQLLVSISMPQFAASDGVLLLLYSVLLTRTSEVFLNEMGDVTGDGLPLVNHLGHGSISILNLLLHGHGVSHLFDGCVDMGGGLQLQGMLQQSDLGYLTVMEALHYCEVGACLKSPRWPIWVLGSETHFTVVVSTDDSITATEAAHERATRIFNAHDTQGNGFIEISAIMAVLRDVVAGNASTCISTVEGESARSLEKRLLPIAHRIDSGGIVLKTDFLNVVSPAQSYERTPLIPSSFPLLHVNCLIKGSDQMPAIIQGEAQWVNDDHPMRSDVLSCLRTKWSGLRVTWAEGIEPSLI